MSDFVNPYTRFAYAYDVMMENVDYVGWADYVEKLFSLYNYRPKRLLNIACGTGSIDILLAQKGYEMSGIDLAFEMIALARKRLSKRASISICGNRICGN
jgi:ubiquinone/menaquinone biosynthesis C-methylase UbiE